MKSVGVREAFMAFAGFTFRAQTRSRLPRARNREDMEGTQSLAQSANGEDMEGVKIEEFTKLHGLREFHVPGSNTQSLAKSAQP